MNPNLRLVASVFFCLSAMLRAGEEYPEIAKIENPAEYEVLTPKLTPAQFEAFVKRAEGGDPIAFDLCFHASFNGLGTLTSHAKAREWIERGCKVGAPLCMLYRGRNLGGFSLDKSRHDDATAQVLCEKGRVFFQPLAEKGNVFAMLAVSGACAGLHDKKGSFEWARKGALGGNAVAMATLSYYYGRGEGGEHDDVAAAEWSKRAAELGLALGKNNYAVALLHGQGVERDVNKAYKLYKEAAEQGEVLACSALGSMYENGQGVEANAEKSFQMYKIAAEEGLCPAIHHMGPAYTLGNGTPVDQALGFKWMQKGAACGCSLGFANLALSHYWGFGTPKDWKLAAENFKRGAQLGDEESAKWLGDIYRVGGNGIEINLPEAAKWYARGADDGSADAQYQYAMLLLTGTGVEKDVAAAANWLKRAASESVEAQNQMGICYRDGVGVAVDLAQAVTFFKLAADKQNGPAMRNLSALYRDGKGVPKDAARADKLALDADDIARREGAPDAKAVRPPSPPKAQDF